MPAPEKPWFPIHTERLILREFREGDLADVHAYAVMPEVSRFMTWGPNTAEESREFLDRALASQADWPRGHVGLAIERNAVVIGSIRLDLHDDAGADLGYTLSQDHWRQGIATEAARAVLAEAFGSLGLHRVWATCDVDNTGSFSVMEKLGMRREAYFRQDRFIRGAWRDSYLYAILAEEWISPG
ncbi:GNAT family protein [Phenylobacterium sp.]|uniref:GNAT family N-acetyltransferase n=1 Tax=Phenylobacterium sp. TaxID=1871053 RepID=UPI0011F9164C|nr:GNAT family protein [Phenylobacterium sp.]THD53606.1 MAG: N-acetyltransferase [Phenylobacterium sp.]